VITIDTETLTTVTGGTALPIRTPEPADPNPLDKLRTGAPPTAVDWRKATEIIHYPTSGDE
jgi:hypothetical protein